MLIVFNRHVLKRVPITTLDFFEQVNIISDPEMKGTTLGLEIIFWFINNQYRSGSSSFMMMKERFKTLNYGLAFNRSSPFYETFNEKITRMIDAGLTDYWIQKTVNPRGLKKSVETIGPEILTMEHLDIAFKISLIAFASSLIVFLAEIVFFQLHKIFLRKCKQFQ